MYVWWDRISCLLGQAILQTNGQNAACYNIPHLHHVLCHCSGQLYLCFPSVSIKGTRSKLLSCHLSEQRYVPFSPDQGFSGCAVPSAYTVYSSGSQIAYLGLLYCLLRGYKQCNGPQLQVTLELFLSEHIYF